jgi:hypothetical protein
VLRKEELSTAAFAPINLQFLLVIADLPFVQNAKPVNMGSQPP